VFSYCFVLTYLLVNRENIDKMVVCVVNVLVWWRFTRGQHNHQVPTCNKAAGQATVEERRRTSHVLSVFLLNLTITTELVSRVLRPARHIIGHFGDEDCYNNMHRQERVRVT